MIRPLFTLLGLACLGLAACDEPDAGAQVGAVQAAPTMTVTVIAAGRPFEGQAPRIMLVADGTNVGEIDVDADRAAGAWGRYAFTITGLRPQTLSVRYLNDAGERDLWIRKVVLDDAEMTAEQATYLRDGREPMPGRTRMSWAGELRFAR